MLKSKNDKDKNIDSCFDYVGNKLPIVVENKEYVFKQTPRIKNKDRKVITLPASAIRRKIWEENFKNDFPIYKSYFMYLKTRRINLLNKEDIEKAIR